VASRYFGTSVGGPEIRVGLPEGIAPKSRRRHSP
jgi:hypothetical protein